MLDNRWAYQMNYHESIKNDAFNSSKIRNFNALEYNEYIDLERRSDERLSKKPLRVNSTKKYSATSKKYA